MSRLIAGFIASALVAHVAAAQTAPPPADARAAIEQALAAYVAAFNSHNVDAVIALWTPEGVYVDKASGQRSEGRDALIADFRALFAGSPEIVLSGGVDGIRMLGDGVAMVDGTTTTADASGEPTTAAFSAIFVKRDGKWLLDSVHEMPLAAPETPRQALQPLAWMVGHWRDNSDAVQVEAVVRWSSSEAFLLRSYTVVRDGELALEGTQVIGWDPRAKQIRSWIFNSDGSFGDGAWTPSGDEWMVQTAQTLADGRAVTATQIVKRVDDQTATVQTIAKDIEGSPEPASEPVTMVRVPDEPAADAADGEASATVEAGQ